MACNINHCFEASSAYGSVDHVHLTATYNCCTLNV